MQSESSAATGKLVLAFFLIYFIWGSTYLAIRYAIETIPPFLMAGVRFLAAGLLMYGFMRLRGAANPTLRQWWQLAIVGMFLFLGGNGLVVWAEQYITSGLAALLVSLLPLWLILIDWLWVGGSAPKPIAMIGILFGIVGTVVLIDPVQFTDSDIHLPGALTVLLASLLWAIGSIYSKKFRQPDSIFMSAAVQMIGGGVSLLLVSAGLGELQGFDPGRISRTSVAGFSYLMVFGSMIAISAYVWLLQNATATSVSTYAFVNPAVAVFLGWLIADEPVNAHILFGAGIILAGVFLVVFASIRKNTVRTVPGPSSIED
jgi:drug/metabolite transporter (DMT)-like permease